MQKIKRLLLLLILTICISLSTTVQASDMLYKVMNFENIKDVNGTYFQDAVVVAKIISSENGQLHTEIIKTVAGNYSKKTAVIAERVTYFNVYGIDPNVNDYIIAPIKIVDQQNNLVKTNFSPCLIKGADINNIKLYITDDHANILEIKAIELYVNSKGKVRAFDYDDSSGVLTVRPSDALPYQITKEQIIETSPVYNKDHDIIQHKKLEGEAESALASGTTSANTGQNNKVAGVTDKKLDLTDLSNEHTIYFYVIVLSFVIVITLLIMVIRMKRHELNHRDRK